MLNKTVSLLAVIMFLNCFPAGAQSDVRQRISVLESEKQQLLKDLQNRAKQESEIVERDQTNLLREIPQWFYVSGRRMPNPEYFRLSREIATVKAEKLNQIQKNLENESRDFIRAFQARAEVLTNSSQAAVQQPVASTQTVGLAPGMTNTKYVQNYVNFGSSEPTPAPPVVPLLAVPGRYNKGPQKAKH